MTTITSVELGATGRYINLGSPSVLDDVLPITVVAYARPSGSGGGGLGYVCCKFPFGSSGMRMIVEHNGGSPRVSFGLTSSGAANNPFVASAANSVVYNTWQHYIATCSAVITDTNVLSSTINVYIENTLSTPSTVLDGNGSTPTDASNDFFLMNRGPSGTLGRDFVGDLAYLAIWNRVLDSTARQNVIDNGPLAEPTGLVLCWANQADLSTNALSVSARSTFAAGTVPPNTSLGDGLSRGATEAASLADPASSTLSVSVARTDSVTLADGLNSSLASSATRTEAATAADAAGATTTGDYGVSVNEAASAGHSQSSVLVGAAAQTDAIAASDACGCTLGIAVARTEAAAAASSETAATALARSVTEAAAAAATQNRMAFGKFVFDLFENNASSPWADEDLVYNWLPSWRIGDPIAASSQGVFTADSSGNGQVAGLPLGTTGAMLVGKVGATAADDGVYFMYGTVV